MNDWRLRLAAAAAKWFGMVLRGIALLVWLGAAPAALGATLSWTQSSETLHVDMPFTLTLSAADFEEEPAPEAPDLVIEGCDVVFLGVTPNVATRIEINLNGQRSESRDVTFNYKWRVTARQVGRYTIPPVRVQQAGVEAAVGAASFAVKEVPATDDMIVRLRLPDRAVWVGETFDATLEWLLTRDVDNYDFVVPLFDLDGAHVAGGATGGDTIRLTAGAQELRLPLRRDTVRERERSYTRFAVPARITLHNVGTMDLPPIRVVAGLKTGNTRDNFGFRRPSYQLFKAQGERQRLTVQPLPRTGRPASFVNAIGEGFAIDVRASRSVVTVGEPIELLVTVRGAPPLTGLSLPPLGGPDALPQAEFSVPEGSVAGTVDEETGTKRFPVTVRVKSAEVREIPPIAFSYFDPAPGEYRTVYSEPTALSVDAGQLVGAGDVVAAPTATAPVPARSTAGSNVGTIATLVGAEMAISDPGSTFERPWGSGRVEAWLGALYGVPVLIALVSFWLQRSHGRRTRTREIRRALAALERILDAGTSAREAAPAIGAAIRTLAVAADADRAVAGAALQRLETRAYDPQAAAERVDDDVIEELRRVARGWAQAAKSRPGGAVAAGLIGLCVLLPPALSADATEAVTQARAAYQAALAETGRLQRVRLFEQAATEFRPIAAANPTAAQLQVDWGNAALGAQDRGRAVLGWRRALRFDPGNERASRNLSWLRDRLPVWLPRPASAGALDSLLFWRNRLTASQLHLIGAVGFAAGAILLVVWRVRRWPWSGATAALAALLWIVATGTALFANDQEDGAVIVVDGATLRSADSTGASPTFPNPLPAGTEISIVEERDAWRRVALADGTRGWLAASAIERVVP